MVEDDDLLQPEWTREMLQPSGLGGDAVMSDSDLILEDIRVKLF